MVGIALGSNLGDRMANLHRAIDALRTLHEGKETDFRLGSIIETEPVDCASGTPAFLNTVIELRCSKTPLEILDFCQSIERDAGRPDIREKNSPRTVDVDILFINEVEMNTERLTLPHPRMEERDFVMIPLREIKAQKAAADS